MSYRVRVQPRKAAGAFLRYSCVGRDYYQILSDGAGGEYAVLANPATPALVRYGCEDEKRRAYRRNGTCEEFPAELAPTNTFVREQCMGDDLYAIRRHGNCPEFTAEVIEVCSLRCGCGRSRSCEEMGCCGVFPACRECGGERFDAPSLGGCQAQL